MSSVGLVLGGGGITGASYHFGALLALEMATGWHPDEAAVIVGTSCGAFAAAMTRGGGLSIDTFLGDAKTRDEVSERLRNLIFRRTRPRGVLRWLRRGVLPGLARPDLKLVLGSPALYETSGVAEWVAEVSPAVADTWPDKPTVIVAYDLNGRTRTPFGTEAAPDVALKDAVAASVAVPFVFEPVRIDDRSYVDGGITSGTHADLVLANPEPLDLLIVVAPLAADQPRDGARFYEDMFDRVGRTALEAELALIRDEWPHTDILVFRPDVRVQEALTPNPLSIRAAIPAFLRTLRSFDAQLSQHDTWLVLERHLGHHAARR